MTIWKIGIPLLAVVGIAGCAQSVAEPAADEEHEEPAVVVRVVPAESRTLEQIVKALGQCEALVDKRALVTPAVEGHVRTILVAPGAHVKVGQPIVELDTRLPAADLAEKRAIRTAAEASMALLQSLPRPQEQRVSKLAVEQGLVAQQRAQSLLDNLKPLAQRNEVSAQQLFDAEKAVDQARLQKESAEAQFDVSMTAPRAEAVEEAKSRILIAEQAAQAAEARLDLHTLRAPIDGVLEDVTCHLGQTIAVGASVGEIVDATQLYVLAWLPPRDALLVHVGQKAQVFAGTLAPATPAGESESDENGAPVEVSSEVMFIGQVTDPQTGNLPVRCLVDNADGRLKIGQTVSVKIAVDEHNDVLSVPVAAIFDLGEGPLVNVVREGKSVPLHPRLGLAQNGWVGVSETDLEPGEPVIVEGGYNLKVDTPVSVEDPHDGPAAASDDSPSAGEHPE